MRIETITRYVVNGREFRLLEAAEYHVAHHAIHAALYEFVLRNYPQKDADSAVSWLITWIEDHKGLIDELLGSRMALEEARKDDEG